MLCFTKGLNLASYFENKYIWACAQFSHSCFSLLSWPSYFFNPVERLSTHHRVEKRRNIPVWVLWQLEGVRHQAKLLLYLNLCFACLQQHHRFPVISILLWIWLGETYCASIIRIQKQFEPDLLICNIAIRSRAVATTFHESCSNQQTFCWYPGNDILEYVTTKFIHSFVSLSGLLNMPEVYRNTSLGGWCHINIICMNS